LGFGVASSPRCCQQRRRVCAAAIRPRAAASTPFNAEQPRNSSAESLGILYIVYGYSGFTAGRQPKAASVISNLAQESAISAKLLD
jgi:hypothetical protein